MSIKKAKFTFEQLKKENWVKLWVGKSWTNGQVQQSQQSNIQKPEFSNALFTFLKYQIFISSRAFMGFLFRGISNYEMRHHAWYLAVCICIFEVELKELGMKVYFDNLILHLWCAHIMSEFMNLT